MDFTYCAQCGAEIEGKGIQFRSRSFCGDDCCEEFEADFIDKGEPELAELNSDDLDEVELDDNGLGYRNDGDADDDDDDDDDFAIDPDDF